MIQNYNIKEKIKNKKDSIQFLPEILLNISKNENVLHLGKNLKISYIIDLVHNLLLRYFFKKENIFKLSSLILKEKYGYLYNYYMDFLVQNKIIFLSKEYMNGKNARIYRLCENIITDNILRYSNKDKVLLKKYIKYVSSIDNLDFVKNPILPEIKQKIVSDLFSIEIDIEKSFYYLDNTIQDKDSYNKNKYSVESIHQKHIFYHFDRYGRFHTNFTILKSFIRKNCLLIDGEETYEQDVNNSQPLFLCKLIKDYDCGIVSKNEFELYKILTTKGVFYQYVMDNTNIKEKNKCKEIIYKVFFGQNNNSYEDLIFKGLFPTVYMFIKSFKKEMGDYRILSHSLQKIESEFIFNKLIYNIMIINPDIKVITVHDSIIFKKKYKDIVTDLFNNLLSEEIDC